MKLNEVLTIPLFIWGLSNHPVKNLKIFIFNVKI
jgi:hypothetical protein